MVQTEVFGLSLIGQVSMRVKDLERATAFCRDTLGMKHLFAVSGMSFFDCGGVRLMLTEAETAKFDHPGSRCGTPPSPPISTGSS